MLHQHYLIYQLNVAHLHAWSFMLHQHYLIFQLNVAHLHAWSPFFPVVAYIILREGLSCFLIDFVCDHIQCAVCSSQSSGWVSRLGGGP